MGGNGFADIDCEAAALFIACEFFDKRQGAGAFQSMRLVLSRTPQRQIGFRLIDGETDASETPADGAVQVEEAKMQPSRSPDADRCRRRG